MCLLVMRSEKKDREGKKHKKTSMKKKKSDSISVRHQRQISSAMFLSYNSQIGTALSHFGGHKFH